jgi:hypothetical protein
MSDMIVEGAIPEPLRPFAHVGACIAGAQSDRGWRTLLANARLPVERAWDESDALVEMIASIKRKLVGFALAKASGVIASDVAIDVAQGRDLLREADRTVRAGIVRYGAYTARKREPS